MNYLEKNHKGEAIKTLDGEGNVENVYIADDQDRIKGKKALRKLAYPGRKIDNVQQEIVSHVDEIAAVSQYDHFGSDNNNKHGSFAKNGWDYRKAYAMTEDNRVWECILNVALGERRNVLYDINSIKEIRDQKAKEKIMKSDRNMNSQKQDSLQNQTEGAEIAGANTPLSQRNSRRQTSINQSISQDNAEVNTSVRSGQSDDTPDVQHSIVGRQAENANQSLMNQAMVEAEQGRSVDEIWQNTGWIKGQDGKWRFEIDDSSASLVGKAFQNLKDGQKVDLQDILHHPELMENYPQLKGIKVALDGNLRRYDAVYAPLPHKFEAGTVNAGGAAALGSAIDYLEQIGFQALREREDSLTTLALERMKEIPGVHVLGSEDAGEHCGILTFTVDEVHPHDVASILDADHIAVRAGHHCAQPLLKHLGHLSTTRASLAFYNTEDEVDRFVASLSTIRERMGYGK